MFKSSNLPVRCSSYRSSYCNSSHTTPVVYIVVPTGLGCMLVPLLVVLFYFSTAQSRCAPTFRLIILAILLALAETAMILTISVRSLIKLWWMVLKIQQIWRILHPFEASPPIYLLILLELLLALPTFIVDIILMLRVVAVYPPSLTTLFVTLTVYGPLIIFKILRVAGLIMVAINVDQNITYHVVSAATALTGDMSMRGWEITTWGLTLVDNA